ncbi:nuclear egress membrane protein [Testudinid alphaherpesvirus 3]|uniref:Nuclear egress membrane protein n=1 Tax=Testudinid alphaherpesvirus 3 TaxID=2560801 RepID=A0A0K1R1Y3_9ALPH|nr:nuclear egress membrane protein [Testudinid alphaherpesvirus 3]AIU39261.1 nuclear egress membrane protein [Testudinid alphaherpesvirus 3]AIU39371.1 nuclear egress membrane protein [Testudinid alphaherpesvirus 3]AKI81647.1 nuclear egress membrane protein [Testudinid alphaherpesvirus 3]AKI81750.1 nuclear egress membrane protein [Testudinid alphaherpesvirus 3]AKV40706.1 UL34 membrane associated phosphoprotein [Testudinid alphaherpesvirus 3]
MVRLTEKGYSAMVSSINMILGLKNDMIRFDSYGCATTNPSNGFFTAMLTERPCNIEYLLLKIKHCCGTNNPYLQFSNIGVSVTMVGYMEKPTGQHIGRACQSLDTVVLARGDIVGISLADIKAKRVAGKITANPLAIQMHCQRFTLCGSDSVMLNFRFNVASDANKLAEMLDDVRVYALENFHKLNEERRKTEEVTKPPIIPAPEPHVSAVYKNITRWAVALRPYVCTIGLMLITAVVAKLW